ncbi:MAG: hypothetical protein HC850_08390 [Rhodomicrobium sp.]|nr:hypothetical protein [Rhodomicrobium sp.]
MRRLLITTAALQTIAASALAQGEALFWKAMKEIQARGVQLKPWPVEIVAAPREAWQAAVAEEFKRSPNFDQIYASNAAFRVKDSIWRHFSYLQ